MFGDALAAAPIKERGFSTSDFSATSGRRSGEQRTTIGLLTGTDDEVPVAQAGARLMDATIGMSQKRSDCTEVVDGANHLIGACTDCDLRRSFATDSLGDVSAHISPQPLSVAHSTLLSEALRIMNDNAVSDLRGARRP